MKTLIVASPHRRYDGLQGALTNRLVSWKVFGLRDREELKVESLEEIDPQWIFFPHWPWVIPESIHSRFRCVIFHMTDLPFGRGGSPLQNLIVRGHKSTQLSAIKCVSQIDGGPIYMKKAMGLHGTAEEILMRAAHLMEEMICEIVKTNPTPSEQVGEVTEFKRRNPRDGDMAELETLGQVFDFIRMLDGDEYPYPFLETENLVYEFYEAKELNDYVEAKVRIRKRK